MATDLSPSAYDAFAPFYDAFTAASDYETWTQHVLPEATRHGLTGETLLDLACGTGKSFLPFARRGFRVTACDGSAAMLAEAALKAPEAELLHCDMRDLPAAGSFDLVTCFDDSLNYLLEADDLLSCFRGIAANLAPGGVAAATIEIFANTCDALYERVVTRHEQRHFPRDEVVALLGRAGLRCAAVRGVLDDGRLVERADEDSQLKVLYIARHAEGGGSE